MEEATEADGLVLRRAARLLATKDWPDHTAETCRRLRELADLVDAPELCEGCDEPAEVFDEDGVGLCAACGSPDEALP